MNARRTTGRQLAAVFRKEMTDGLRDRRSLGSALLVPVLMPLLFGGMIAVISSKVDRELESLAVRGAERAPDLVEFAERRDVEIRPLGPDADPEALVADGTEDVVLVVPEEIADDLAAGRRSRLEVIVDGSDRTGARAARQVRALVEDWGRQTGALRLLARGVRPEVAHPVEVDTVDLASPQATAARAFDFLPLLLVMAAFVGGLNVAIDATAGERERRSLEPLLLNPVPRGALVAGKWSATFAFAAFGVAAMLASSFAVLDALPRLGYELPSPPPPTAALGLLAACLPLAAFAAAVEMLVSTYARSFKEAQTYASFLILVPMLPSFLLQIEDVEPSPALALVPGLSHHQITAGLLAGEPVSAAYLAISVVSSLLLAAACASATARLLGKERIVFGR